MRKLKTTLLVLISVLVAPIILFIGAIAYERYKPTHWLDRTARYIRTHASGQEYVALAPFLFEKGMGRDVVEQRLAASNFQPAAGTSFALQKNTGEEKWFRRDQNLALWHFNVHVRFDKDDRLLSARGMVAGPTFE